MFERLYSGATKMLRSLLYAVPVTSAGFFLPEISFAMQGKAATAAADVSCEMELGDKKVVRGRLDVPGLSQARLRCGAEVYDAGLAHKIDGAVHQKSGNRLMLIEAPVGQKMVIFRKPSAASTGKEKRFGQFEVIEQDMKRAIVSLKAFEERGDVVIWRRGGP